MRKLEQRQPAFVREFLGALQLGGVRRDRAITGKNSFPEEVFRLGINGKLKISVEEAGADALVEARHQIVGGGNLHHALKLAPGGQAQGGGSDYSEQTVSPVCQPEQLGIF